MGPAHHAPMAHSVRQLAAFSAAHTPRAPLERGSQLLVQPSPTGCAHHVIHGRTCTRISPTSCCARLRRRARQVPSRGSSPPMSTESVGRALPRLSVKQATQRRALRRRCAPQNTLLSQSRHRLRIASASTRAFATPANTWCSRSPACVSDVPLACSPLLRTLQNVNTGKFAPLAPESSSVPRLSATPSATPARRAPGPPPRTPTSVSRIPPAQWAASRRRRPVPAPTACVRRATGRLSPAR